MKIVHISTYDQRGGAAIACQRIWKAQQNNGLDAQFLVQEKSSNDTRIVAIAENWWQRKSALGRFVLERLYYLPYEVNKQKRFSFSPAQAGIDISRYALIKEADVIQLHWVNFGFLSLKTLGKLFQLGKPVVWTLHDMWTFTGGCHYAGTCHNYVDKCGHCQFLKQPSANDFSAQIHEEKADLFRQAKMHVVTSSHWLKRLAEKSSLLRDKKIIQIPTPIDAQAFKPVSMERVRTTLKLPQTSFLVLFGAVKVADERKGFHYLLEALQILAKHTTKPIELIVFGNVGKLKDHELPFPIHFLGSIGDQEVLKAVYASADVFVIPSLEDNLPNTVIESMACGTPVVAFKTGGLPEMIDPLKNGYLAKYRDAKDLAKGILAVQDKTIDWSSNARQKVLDNYTEETVSQRYQQLYDTIMK